MKIPSQINARANVYKTDFYNVTFYVSFFFLSRKNGVMNHRNIGLKNPHKVKDDDYDDARRDEKKIIREMSEERHQVDFY